LPAEIRHIVFCSSEIGAAVREYRRQVNRPLPVGALRRLELSAGKGGGVRLLVEVAPDSGGAPETAELGNAELADALIQYCEAHHIPLPLAGTKGLQRFGDNLLLIVTTNLRGSGWPLSAALSLHPAIPAAPEPEPVALNPA
jgi:hypothetical protein